MKLLEEMNFQAKIIYSVFFDQKWYWLNVRPRLEGTKAWAEFAKICISVWLLSQLFITVSLPAYLFLSPTQDWTRVYRGSWILLASLIVISFLSILGRKNKVARNAPYMICGLLPVSLYHFVSAILVMPGGDANLILLFILLIVSISSIVFGIAAVVASGHGIREGIAESIGLLKKSDHELNHWVAGLFLRSCITGMIALILAPLALIFYRSWEMGAGMQTILAGACMLFGLYLGEKWAGRQVKDLAERKRLASNPE